MITDRFAYQRSAVRNSIGRVLNVGCNEDPAKLKETFGDRVINVDIEDYDEVMSRPNAADVLFDAARDTWPFEDNSAGLVVFGDVLEHMDADEALRALSEARRVAKRLCITVPCDDRDAEAQGQTSSSNPYQFHRMVVTREYLESQLAAAGWEVEEMLAVDYGFVPLGFLVKARRSRDAGFDPL